MLNLARTLAASTTSIGAFGARLRSPAAARFSSAASGSEEVLSVEHLEGELSGVTVLTLNNPKANALSRKLLSSLGDAVNELSTPGSPTRVVVLRSALPRIFCAGADLKERAEMSVAEVGLFVNRLRSTFKGFENLPQPTIAVVEGAAMGGGLELALSADMRVTTNESKLGLVETRLAIVPGAGGTQRLPRLIGAAKAKELMFTARLLTGEQATEIGLANYCVESGDAVERAGVSSPVSPALNKALDLAAEILPNGPVAIQAVKMAVDQGMQVPLNQSFLIEEAAYAKVIPTQDRLEGLAAFKEKRKPVYKGE